MAEMAAREIIKELMRQKMERVLWVATVKSLGPHKFVLVPDTKFLEIEVGLS